MSIVTHLLLSLVIVAQDSESPFTPANIRDPEFIAKKLAAGLSPNVKNDNRFNQDTLLVFAVRNGARETVELLLKAGVNVNQRTTGFAKTPLFQAAFGGDLEVARILVNHKADVNAVDDDGNNALREAILAKKPRMVEYLLEAGCDPSRRNKSRQTMVDLAEQYGTPEIKQMLRAKKPKPAAPQKEE